MNRLRLSLVVLLFAIPSSLTPAQAQPVLPQPTSTAAPLLANLTPKVVALGDDIYLSFECSACSSSASASQPLPAVALTDSVGAPVPGMLSPFTPPGAASNPNWGFLVWRPTLPLAAGDYTLTVMQGTLPATWPQDGSYKITVAGAQRATSDVSVGWTVVASSQPAGTTVACLCSTVPGYPGIDGSTSCGGVPTQTSPVPQLSATSVTQPSSIVANEFFYRAVTLAADGSRAEVGEWTTMPPGVVAFGAIAAMYCLDVETLRLRDGVIGSLGKQCVPNTLDGPPFTPTFFRSDCGPSGSAQQATYTNAWCRDNKSVCESRSAPPECGTDYQLQCSHLMLASGDAGAPLSDASQPYGRDAQPGAGPLSDGGLRLQSPGAGHLPRTSSCSVASAGQAPPSHSALVLAFVALALLWRLTRRWAAGRLDGGYAGYRLLFASYASTSVSRTS